MQQGDEQYRKLLRRYNTLLYLDNPTPQQVAECERIDALLTAAELQPRSIAPLVDDYDEMLKNANHLGAVEL